MHSARRWLCNSVQSIYLVQTYLRSSRPFKYQSAIPHHRPNETRSQPSGEGSGSFFTSIVFGSSCPFRALAFVFACFIGPRPARVTIGTSPFSVIFSIDKRARLIFLLRTGLWPIILRFISRFILRFVFSLWGGHKVWRSLRSSSHAIRVVVDIFWQRYRA